MATTDSMSTEIPATGYDADELGQYRSLSTMAVVAVVLGLCSVLMFASPLMVIFPLAAAAAAILALRSIATSDGGLTGSRLALVGLGLAILFATGSYARVKIRDGMLQQQVEDCCQQWLSLASQGRVDEMLQLMTTSAAEQLKPAEEVGPPGSFFGGMLASALMRQDPLIVAFSNLREQGELRFRTVDAEIYATATPAQAVIDYSVSAGDAEPASCGIGLKRLRAGGNEWVWRIDSWALK